MAAANLKFKNSIFWQQLQHNQRELKKRHLAALYSQDPARAKNFSWRIPEVNLFLDSTKQHLDLATLNLLQQAAKYCNLAEKIQELFAGTYRNITEDRLVWHPKLRDPKASLDLPGGIVHMEALVNSLAASDYTDLVYLGIGGSNLGPAMVCEALAAYAGSHKAGQQLTVHFIANYDLHTLKKLIKDLDPARTILMISSKSFTTLETKLNAEFMLAWLQRNLNIPYAKILATQVFAITANPAKAISMGILPANILELKQEVGGRFSVWSAIGLPIMLKLGVATFKEFLAGAYVVDQHFKNTDLASNLPINLALMSIWNINFMRYQTLAIVPYLDQLALLPAYLQQLVMESNGKAVDLQGKQVSYATSEILWGGVGCNVQHSFMQLLHQGTQIVPVDLLVATDQEFLFANCVAQGQALMLGTKYLHSSQPKNNLPSYKQCLGNRPSNTILFPKLTPKVLGALIALYEHKVFVQGVMWNINSFDQWGVELGKNLATQLLADLAKLTKIMPAELAVLLAEYKRHNHST